MVYGLLRTREHEPRNFQVGPGGFLRSAWIFIAVIAGAVALRTLLAFRNGEDPAAVSAGSLLSVLPLVIASYSFVRGRGTAPTRSEYALAWSFTGLYLLFLFRDTPLHNIAVLGALVCSAMLSATIAQLFDKASASEPMSHPSGPSTSILLRIFPVLAGLMGIAAGYFLWSHVRPPMRQPSVAVLVVFFALALMPRGWRRNARIRMTRRVLLVVASCFLTYVIFPMI